MKKLLLITFQILALLSTSCNLIDLNPDPDPVFTPQQVESKLHVEWHKPVVYETILKPESADVKFIGVDNGLIYYRHLPTSGRLDRRITARNQSDGKLVWETACSDLTDMYWFETIYQTTDKILIHDRATTLAIDKRNGSFLWNWQRENPENETTAWIFVTDQHIYQPVKTGQNQQYDHASLVRTDINQHAEWDTILTFSHIDHKWFPYILSPVLWINPEGDSVLIGQVKWKYNHGDPIAGPKEKCQIFAYNLHKHNIEWSKENIAPFGMISLQNPLVDGNLVYLTHSDMVICLNLINGEKVWDQYIASGLAYADIEIFENKLIIASRQPYLYAFDKSSGVPNWANFGENTSTDDLESITIMNGVIYCTSIYTDKIYSFDTDQGRLISIETSPIHHNDRFTYSFGISGIYADPSVNRLYACDQTYIICFQPTQ